MKIEVREETMTALAEHAAVPIAFKVERILVVSVERSAPGGYVFTECKVDAPYMKDYDAINGENPARWADRFDMSNWGLLSAHLGGRRVGGTVIAVNTPSIEMLEGRSDLAVLWDFRIHPDFRKQGIGSELFLAAEEWARERGCQQLKVETQDINLAACRFYAAQGCVLRAMNCSAYEEFPDEIQLLWYKQLDAGRP